MCQRDRVDASVQEGKEEEGSVPTAFPWAESAGLGIAFASLRSVEWVTLKAFIRTNRKRAGLELWSCGERLPPSWDLQGNSESSGEGRVSP